MTDNKEDKFFYFPMISMPCTGSGYEKELNNVFGSFLFVDMISSPSEIPVSDVCSYQTCTDC